MSNSTKIRVIPPLIPLATMSLGAALYLVWPLPILDLAVVPWVGWVLVLLSFAPAVAGVRALRRAGTTADVRKKATTLVTEGIFRYTRNPMYLALMILCLGLAMGMNAMTMLLMVVPTGSALCLAVIRREEAFLQEQFGSAYANYQRSVRRWA